MFNRNFLILQQIDTWYSCSPALAAKCNAVSPIEFWESINAPFFISDSTHLLWSVSIKKTLLFLKGQHFLRKCWCSFVFWADFWMCQNWCVARLTVPIEKSYVFYKKKIKKTTQNKHSQYRKKLLYVKLCPH